MPLYDYACGNCGQTTEILQRFDDPPLAICPHCGGELTKLLSAPAFHFKGSGWYVTDYARKGGGDKPSGGGEAKAEKSDSAATTAATGSSDAVKGGESKPSSGSSSSGSSD